MKSPLKKLGKQYYDFLYRKEVKSSNFSIICSNCIGGVIYNHMGMQFLSPTINLYIKQNDFIKMCCDLKRYMKEDIQFIDNDLGHPVGKIDDVTIYFNHDNDEKAAAENWYRRRKRINYDNLFIILYYGDGITEDDALKLENVSCKNKIILTPKPIGWSKVDFVSEFTPSGIDMLSLRGMDSDCFGIRTIEKQYNFRDFLNCMSH